MVLLDTAGVAKRALMRVETRVVNPPVERLLRSRLHWLVSERLLLLSYEGRVSGTRITTPVLYERDGDDVVVTTHREAVNWWKNFRGSYPATLWLRGEPVEVTGAAVLNASEIADWLAYLGARSWLWRRLLGRFGVSARDSLDDLESTAENVVVVRFRRVRQ